MDSRMLPLAVESSLNDAIAAACDQFIPYRSRLKLKGTLIIDGRGENKVSVRLNKDLIKDNKLSYYKSNDQKSDESQEVFSNSDDLVKDLQRKRFSQTHKTSSSVHSKPKKCNQSTYTHCTSDPLHLSSLNVPDIEDRLPQVKHKMTKSSIIPSKHLDNNVKENELYLRAKVGEISQTMETLFLPEGIELRYCMCGSCGGVILDYFFQDIKTKTKGNDHALSDFTVDPHLESGNGADFIKAVEHVKPQVAPQHVTTQVAPQQETVTASSDATGSRTSTQNASPADESDKQKEWLVVASYNNDNVIEVDDDKLNYSLQNDTSKDNSDKQKDIVVIDSDQNGNVIAVLETNRKSVHNGIHSDQIIWENESHTGIDAAIVKSQTSCKDDLNKISRSSKSETESQPYIASSWVDNTLSNEYDLDTNVAYIHKDATALQHRAKADGDEVGDIRCHGKGNGGDIAMQCNDKADAGDIAMQCNDKGNAGDIAMQCNDKGNGDNMVMQCNDNVEQGKTVMQCLDKADGDDMAMQCNGKADNSDTAIQCNEKAGGDNVVMQYPEKADVGHVIMQCHVKADGGDTGDIQCNDKNDPGGDNITNYDSQSHNKMYSMKNAHDVKSNTQQPDEEVTSVCKATDVATESEINTFSGNASDANEVLPPYPNQYTSALVKDAPSHSEALTEIKIESTHIDGNTPNEAHSGYDVIGSVYDAPGRFEFETMAGIESNIPLKINIDDDTMLLPSHLQTSNVHSTSLALINCSVVLRDIKGLSKIQRSDNYRSNRSQSALPDVNQVEIQNRNGDNNGNTCNRKGEYYHYQNQDFFTEQKVNAVEKTCQKDAINSISINEHAINDITRNEICPVKSRSENTEYEIMNSNEKANFTMGIKIENIRSLSSSPIAETLDPSQGCKSKYQLKDCSVILKDINARKRKSRHGYSCMVPVLSEKTPVQWQDTHRISHHTSIYNNESINLEIKSEPEDTDNSINMKRYADPTMYNCELHPSVHGFSMVDGIELQASKQLVRDTIEPKVHRSQNNTRSVIYDINPEKNIPVALVHNYDNIHGTGMADDINMEEPSVLISKMPPSKEQLVINCRCLKTKTKSHMKKLKSLSNKNVLSVTHPMMKKKGRVRKVRVIAGSMAQDESQCTVLRRKLGRPRKNETVTKSNLSDLRSSNTILKSEAGREHQKSLQTRISGRTRTNSGPRCGEMFSFRTRYRTQIVKPDKNGDLISQIKSSCVKNTKMVTQHRNNSTVKSPDQTRKVSAGNVTQRRRGRPRKKIKVFLGEQDSTLKASNVQDKKDGKCKRDCKSQRCVKHKKDGKPKGDDKPGFAPENNSEGQEDQLPILSSRSETKAFLAAVHSEKNIPLDTYSKVVTNVKYEDEEVENKSKTHPSQGHTSHSLNRTAHSLTPCYSTRSTKCTQQPQSDANLHPTMGILQLSTSHCPHLRRGCNLGHSPRLTRGHNLDRQQLHADRKSHKSYQIE